MTGLGSLGGKHPRGHRNPWIWRQGGGIISDWAEATGVDEADSPGEVEKAGRVLDRVPRPAIWEPGQWAELTWRGRKGYLSLSATGLGFSQVLFHYYAVTLVRRAAVCWEGAASLCYRGQEEIQGEDMNMAYEIAILVLPEHLTRWVLA